MLAPGIIGIGYAICLSKFDHALISGFSMIIFSFPATFILAIINWMLWRIFYNEISKLTSCFLGLIVGLAMGAMLSYILCDKHYYFLTLSGITGLIIGYINFYLLNQIMEE